MEEKNDCTNPEQPLLDESGLGLNSSWKKTLALLTNYVGADIQKRPRSFRIGVFSVFIVVAFLSMLFSIVLLSSVVYLKVSENETGETDIYLVPVPASNDTSQEEQTFRLINYYEIEAATQVVDSVEGVAPRWILPGYVYNQEVGPALNTSSFVIVADTKKERDIGLGRNFYQRVLGYGEAYVSASVLRVLGIDQYQGQHLTLFLNLIQSFTESGIIDSEYETEEEAIRFFLNEFGLLDGIGNVTISGDDLEESFDTGGIPLPDLTLSSEQVEDLIVNALVDSIQVELSFTIIQPVEEPDGKWPKSLGNVVLVDAKYVQTQLLDVIEENLNAELSFFGDVQVVSDLIQSLREIDILEYTLFANVMLKDRVDLYTNNVDYMKRKMTESTNDIYRQLGFGHGSVPQLLLAQQMEGAQIIKTFLNNIFMAVLLFLTILSVLLIYSLMMGNIDEKTYEFGMLRALGLKQSQLVNLLVIQASSFAFPGLIMGLFVGILLNLIAAFFIGWYTGLPVDLILHPYAFILAIALGTVLPGLSTYIPIKRALTKTLRDSLDLYHRIVSGVKVTILKLQKLGLSPPTLVASLLLVTLGFLTYYVVPLTFQLEKLEIFLYLLNSVLLLTILGLTFVVHMLQPYLEVWLARALVYLSVKDRCQESIVTKNLEGHGRRNWKTSLMFCMALSFVIFAGVGFRLQGSMIKNTLMSTLGGDIYVMAPENQRAGLAEQKIRDWIENVYKVENGENIKDYSFVTYDLDSMPDISSVYIGNICGFPSTRTRFRGVEENYLDAVYEEFYVPIEGDPAIEYPERDNGNPDFFYGLYTDDDLVSYLGDYDYYDVLTGKSQEISRQVSSTEMLPVKSIVAEGLREFLSITADTPIRFRVYYNSWDEDVLFRGRVRGMAQKVPGFTFSGYRYIGFSHQALVSIPQFREILDVIYQDKWPEELDQVPEGTSYEIPKQYLLIKTKDELSKQQREVLSNGIRNFFQSDDYTLIDVQALKETANLTVVLMEIFFIAVGVIAFILAFFLLWTSFTANVQENSWEYGVLRSIGLTAPQCLRVYMYESLSLTLAAALLGSFTGVMVALVLSIQFNLFVELPLSFEFPFLMFFTMLVLAVLTAVFGSYIPVKNIEKHKISSILRGINF